MREIKFRGKHIETGRWVYGYYVCTHNRHRIIYEDYEGFYCEEEVIPETVGQYTGLKDKNGTPIYEGDLLKHPVEVVAEIKYDNDTASFIAVYTENDEIEMNHLDKKIVGKCEVIGNIFEHPHLLEVEGK